MGVEHRNGGGTHLGTHDGGGPGGGGGGGGCHGGGGVAGLPQVGWEILLLPPRACTNIMTGTNHLLGRAHGGKYSLELKLLHRVLIWDD